MKHEVCGSDPGCGLAFTGDVCTVSIKLVDIICKCFQGRIVHWIFMLMPCPWPSAKVAEGRVIKSAIGKKKVEEKAPGKAAPP